MGEKLKAHVFSESWKNMILWYRLVGNRSFVNTIDGLLWYMDDSPYLYSYTDSEIPMFFQVFMSERIETYIPPRQKSQSIGQ